MAQTIGTLTREEIQRLPREKTAFLISLGGFEDHGSHLPIDASYVKSQALQSSVAHAIENQSPEWKVITLPALPLSIETATQTDVSFVVRPYIVRDALVDLLLPLVRMGFVHFACTTGQPGPKQLTAIEEANRVLRQKKVLNFLRKEKKPFLAAVDSLRISAKEVLQSPIRFSPEEHGGKLDTSVYQAKGERSIDVANLRLPDLKKTLQLKREGYWGEPAQADPHDGEEWLKKESEMIADHLLSAWEGSRSSKKLFRTWYSIFPMNKSYFSALLLSVSIAILMAVWAYFFLSFSSQL